MKQLNLFEEEKQEAQPAELRYCQTCGVQLAVELGSITSLYSRCEPCLRAFFSIPKRFIEPEQLAEVRRAFHDSFLYDRLTGNRWTDRRLLYLKTSLLGWSGVYDAERVLNGRWFASQPKTGEFWYVLNEPLTEERRQWLERHESIQSFLDEPYT